MSLLFSVLVAAAVITAGILLRLFADRSLLRSKAFGTDRTSTDCGHAPCSHTCDPNRSRAGVGPVGEDNASKRSAHHAP